MHRAFADEVYRTHTLSSRICRAPKFACFRNKTTHKLQDRGRSSRRSLTRCSSAVAAAPVAEDKTKTSQEQTIPPRYVPGNRIDQFISEVQAADDTPSLDKLRHRLRKLSDRGSKRAQEQGVREFYEEAAPVSAAAEDPQWSAEVLVALLNPAYEAQEEAVWALAEAAAGDKATRQVLGGLGAVGDLREILETPSLRAPNYTGAIIALGVLCRSPNNACLLVNDVERDGDLGHEAPPTLEGLAWGVDMGSGPLRRTATQLKDTLTAVHHIKRSLRHWHAWEVAGRQVASSDRTANRMPESVQKALEEICGHGTAWKQILPHVLVKQLLPGSGGFLLASRKNCADFGTALLLAEGPQGEAVRGECLPVLLEVLESDASEQMKEKVAEILSKATTSASGRLQAVKAGALPVLLRLLNGSEKKHKILREVAAEGVRSLMLDELEGEGVQEAEEARGKALTFLYEVRKVTGLELVAEKLDAVLEVKKP